MTQRYNTWAESKVPSSVASKQQSTRQQPNFIDYLEQRNPQSVNPPPSNARQYLDQHQKQSIDPEAVRQVQETQKYTLRGDQGERNIERLQQQERYGASRSLNEPQLAMSIAPEKQKFTPYSTISDEEIRKRGQQEYQSKSLIYENVSKPKIEKFIEQKKENVGKIRKIADTKGYKYTEKEGGIYFEEPVSQSDYYEIQSINKKTESQFNAIKPYLNEREQLNEISGIYGDVAFTKNKMIEVEQRNPQRLAQERLSSQFESIKPYLNEEGNGLNWQTKALIGDIPFVGGITGFITRPLTQRDEKINEFVASKQKYDLEYGEKPKPISFKGMDTSLQTTQKNILSDPFYQQNVTKENYGEFSQARDVLGAYDQLKQGGGQTRDINYNSSQLNAITSKVSDYEQKETIKKELVIGGEIALLYATSGASAFFEVGALTKAGRIAAFGNDLLKGSIIYDLAIEKNDLTGELYKIKTVYQTGDLSYIYKDKEQYKNQYLTASKAEQESLSGVGGFVNKYAPQLRDRETRALLGSALFLISKGKVGKIVGSGLAITAYPPIDKMLGISDVGEFKSSLSRQGLSESEINFVSGQKTAVGIKSGIALGLISTQSEIMGEKILSRYKLAEPSIDLSTKATEKLYGIIPVSPAFKEAYKDTRYAMLGAGAYEGVQTAKIQADTELRDATWKEKALYGSLGAISARVVGGSIVGLSTSRKPLAQATKKETFAMGAVYLTDTSEYLGDITADAIMDFENKFLGRDLTKTYIKQGSKPETVNLYASTSKGRVRIPTFTEFSTQQSAFEDTMSNVAIDPRTSFYTPTSSDVIIDITPSVSQPVNIQSNVPVQTTINLPISTPIGTFINLPTNTRMPTLVPGDNNLPTLIQSPISLPQNVDFPLLSPINLPTNLPTNTNVNVDLPTEIPINVNVVVPRLPIFYPLSFDKNWGSGKQARATAKDEYTPDLISLFEGFTTTSTPRGIFTGSEIRPIVINKYKGVKKSYGSAKTSRRFKKVKRKGK